MSGYPPHQQPPPYGMHVPMQPVQVVIPQPLGPHSQTTTCPNCQKVITTRVDQEATMKTHLFALLLCLLCFALCEPGTSTCKVMSEEAKHGGRNSCHVIVFCWPCACVPYCSDSCRATNHYCPNCGAFLGAHDQ